MPTLANPRRRLFSAPAREARTGDDMSQPLDKAEVLFRQRLLKCCGYYQGKLDSDWGPKTEAAETAFQSAAAALISEFGEFDPRTEGNIRSLHIKAQRAARQFMAAVASGPHVIKILSGTRTYAEQDKLYAKGRGLFSSEKKVTNARGGESNHNFGVAWDIGIFENGGRYMTGDKPQDGPAYAAIGKIVKDNLTLSPILEWGGIWKTLPDAPHYQLRTAVTGKAIRSLFEAGTPYHLEV